MNMFGLDFLGLKPNSLCGEFKSEAQRENSLMLMEIFNRFSNIAITRYDWTGLPDSVSERFLNMALFFYGEAAFFFDENLGYLALPCAVGGEYNLYYNPIRVNAFSFNYSKMLEKDTFVYMRNNPTSTPTAISVFTYAKRMADVLRTIDVITKKLKQPYIILCEEKDRQTYLNLIKSALDNEILIIGSKRFGMEKNNLDILKVESNADLVKLWDTYRSYENMMCTVLGIESVGPEKRERLLIDEVNANNMLTDMSIEQNIKELQKACEDINKKFNLDVWVEAKKIKYYREEINNGEIYNRAENSD